MQTIHTTDSSVEQIGRAAFPDYNGRKYRVKAFQGPKNLASYWSDGSRDYFALLHLATCKRVPLPENGSGFGSFGAGLEMSELPEGVCLVERSIYRGKEGGLTLYVRPENLAAMLPPAPAGLTWEMRVVLAATSGLKPAYRLQYAMEETGIKREAYETARQACIAAGLLNKAGAITNEGRNVLGDGINLLSKLAAEVGFSRWGIRPA